MTAESVLKEIMETILILVAFKNIGGEKGLVDEEIVMEFNKSKTCYRSYFT